MGLKMFSGTTHLGSPKTTPCSGEVHILDRNAWARMRLPSASALSPVTSYNWTICRI